MPEQFTDRIPCRVLTGPTASGKSDLALRLAREMNWEIICMDSMQIYRRMDIGTAKPTAEERKLVPHHMIDILEPTESFSVAEYRVRAEEVVRKIRQEKGRDVLFVGGTGLYLQALMHPMTMGQVPADENLRNELRRTAETEEGKRSLHEQLRQMDPATADRLPVGDVRRIIRAIEVTRLTGIPFSRQPQREENADTGFSWTVAALCMERTALYERINRRVERMVREGLPEEVRALLREGVPEDAQSMNGIGYRQMIPFVRGEISLEEAVREIQLASRHYAKRQMTFLRREESVIWLDAMQPDLYETLKERMLETNE